MSDSKPLSEIRKKTAHNEQTWIEKIENGDQEAFKGFFQKYFPILTNFVMPYVIKKEIAEEVVQDVFMSIWNRRTQLSHIKNIDAYLYQSARNHAINYLKKRKPLGERVLNNSLLNSGVDFHSPDNELILKNLSEAAIQIIAELPPIGQKAYRLIREEDLTYKEAAQELGVSISTIQTHVERAIKKLRLRLKDFL